MGALLVAVAVAAVLAAGGAQPQADGVTPVRSAAASSKETPVLAFVRSGEADRLSWIDPVSLRAVGHGRRLLLGSAGNWAFSPEGQALAVSVVQGGATSESSALRLVDLRNMRAGRVRQVGRGFVAALAWPRADRIVAAKLPCCTPGVDVLVLDRRGLRVLERTSLDASLIAAGRTRTELVLLTAPSDTIGAATLSTVGADGVIRSLVLEHVGAGWRSPDDDQPETVHVREPGLAVDPARRHAYVVTPERVVADIDLATLAVSYHDLARRSFFSRFRNWLEPAVNAKLLEGSRRYARWLGGGLLAVSGYDSSVVGSGEAAGMRTEPAGLELIDVSAWTSRRLNERSMHFVFGEGMLFATGTRLDHLEESSAIGLSAYRFDGTPAFRLFDGERVLVPVVSGGRAYVSREHSPFAIVDLAQGSMVGERSAPLPRILSAP